MLTAWYIENFKSVEYATDLALRPLTIIAGANSSGKSTILQSMLLISQTLQSRFKQQDLIPNGELLRLGTPHDILHFSHPNDPLRLAGILDFGPVNKIYRALNLPETNLPTSREITFDLTFHISNNPNFVSKFSLLDAYYERKTYYGDIFSINFSRKKDSNETGFKYDVIEFKPQDLLPSNTTGLAATQFLPTDYRFKKSAATAFKEEIDQIAGIVKSVPSREDMIEAAYNRDLSSDVIAYLSLIADVIQDLFKSPQLLARLRNARTLADLIVFTQELASSGDIANFNRFSFELQDVGRQEQMISQLKGVKDVIRSCPSRLRQGTEDMQKYFEENVHYLGPLRDDPRVIYAIPTNVDFRNVGLKGEFTAAMLNQYGKLPIIYPKPSDDPNQVIPEILQVPLLEAVGIWLKHMGLVDDIEVQEIINVGYQLNVQQSGSKENMALTNVGVGVSQILPTLVMCLLASSPCTLLIEQPELHLHPKVQSILGDFFLGLTYIGKQCIVETHSEHIINRLFLRIAQDDANEVDDMGLRKRIGILFVEKEGRQSKFRQVQPNEFGAIPSEEWPKGFLDQATIEIQRKFEATKEKRKKRKGI